MGKDTNEQDVIIGKLNEIQWSIWQKSHLARTGMRPYEEQNVNSVSPNEN